MSINTISKILIAFSVVMIFIAMSMDTSVSTGYGRVNNLGLINEQSNMLILGSVGFLAGIILFATAKIKQTPEEEVAAKLNQGIAVEKTKKEIVRVVESSKSGFIEFLQTIWTNLDNKKGRGLTFLFCCIAFSSFVIFYELSYAMSDFYKDTRIAISSIESMIYIVLGLYAIRPISASRVMKHMYLLIMLLALVNLLRVCLSFYDQWETYATALTATAIFWGGISLFIFWRIERKERLKLAF